MTASKAFKGVVTTTADGRNSRYALNRVMPIACFDRLGVLGSLDRNVSNRPLRTRMPGAAGGDRSATLAAPMPISLMQERQL